LSIFIDICITLLFGAFSFDLSSIIYHLPMASSQPSSMFGKDVERDITTVYSHVKTEAVAEEQPKPTGPPPPPNGGTRAWLQVLGAFS
jgi:hypothetical protein